MLMVSTRRKNVGWQEGGSSAVSSEAEENKAIVRRFLEETMARGNLDVIDELLAPDFVDRNLMPGQGPTREDYKRSLAEILEAIPITSLTIEEQVAEGDTVVTKYRQSAVERREIMGIPPSGKEETNVGIRIHRISGGEITEEWNTFDVRPVQESLAQELRERERIEQDLRVARHIQQASLPKEVPQLEGWQIAPYYQPAREVGGDFYDFHLLSGGQLGLVVGDATGKGVPAALVMSTTCGILQAISEALDSSSSPGEVLERVNEALTIRIPANMFVTCFYAVLDPKSASLRYANAGHDVPYLHRGRGGAEELRARGCPWASCRGWVMRRRRPSWKLARVPSSTAMGWWRRTTLRGRCSVSRDCVNSSQSTLRRGR
jgi:predicted ester cyclase